MKLIEMKIKDIEAQGVYAVSLVDSPAIEEDFIYLSTEDDEDVKLAVTEQGMVYGLALIPDKHIPRRDKDGNIYNIFFSAETIKETAHLFLSRQQNNNATLGHKVQTKDVSFVESWIIEDPENDKLNALGLKAIKGAWALGGKINSDQLKEDIKLGKFKGFSIEGTYDVPKTLLEKLEELLNKYEQINKSK